ncbi:uncharacterized protein VTP21DRAFT_1559 [Calcarisporiella thermophila]|uniref:uncharacterized protein n=1 Tax=Calcarisporiella thermophila TaxID=911321 RepID=UPI003743FAEE
MTDLRLGRMLLILLLACLPAARSQQVVAPRTGQNCALDDSTLYCYGGWVRDAQNPQNPPVPTNEMLELALSQSFDLQNPPWNAKSFEALPPIADNQCAIVGKHFLVFGGNSPYPSDKILDVSLQQSKWWTVDQQGDAPPRLHNAAMAVNKQNMIYLDGGAGYNANGSPAALHSPSLYVYQPLRSLWTKLPANGSETIHHTWTPLPDGRFFVYGGKFANGTIRTNATLFYSEDNTWHDVAAQGIPVVGRVGHSTLLINDRTILVYGGMTYADGKPVPAQPDIALFDLPSWNWTAPVMTNVTNPRTFHSAFLYKKRYMVVAFGQEFTNASVYVEANQTVQILDLNTYTWLSNYVVSPQETATTNAPPPKEDKFSKFASGTRLLVPTALLALVAAVAGGAFILV